MKTVTKNKKVILNDNLKSCVNVNTFHNRK